MECWLGNLVWRLCMCWSFRNLFRNCCCKCDTCVINNKKMYTFFSVGFIAISEKRKVKMTATVTVNVDMNPSLCAYKMCNQSILLVCTSHLLNLGLWNCDFEIYAVCCVTKCVRGAVWY